MNEFNADLHLHSPHSISVSKAMDLPALVHGARQKGLHLLGTGDCMQPTWCKYLRSTLEKNNDEFSFNGVHFILQTEIETAGVHQVIFLPDFPAVEELRKNFRKWSKNIDGEWGGRPNVNTTLTETVEAVCDAGGLIGPAHAFTPFKSLFRQGGHDSLDSAYGARAKDVHFIELGLSANTDYADRIQGLHRVTFLSNSDAHSPSPSSLGREFNTLLLETPSFTELDLAIHRVNGRRVTRNAGFHPALGKYNSCFCVKCRRRVIFDNGRGKGMRIDKDLLRVAMNEKNEFMTRVAREEIRCPACEAESGKTGKKGPAIKLGVAARVEMIADLPTGKHPSHRPPYIDIVPLTEIIRASLDVKSPTSKTVTRLYEYLINAAGPEIFLLLEAELEKIDENAISFGRKRELEAVRVSLATIEAARSGNVSFLPGGGGSYGSLLFTS